MSEEKVPAGERVLQISEEPEIGWRQRTVKCCLQLGDFRSACHDFSGNPVRHQRFQATQSQPLIEETAIAQALDRDQLMVALQEHARVRPPMFEQTVDGLAPSRAPNE